MKKERAAFAERLRAALIAKSLDTRPVELVKLLARYGRISVTQQAISGWLSGKHMPKQDRMRALSKLLDMPISVLQFGEKASHAVREPRPAWPDLTGPDRLAWDEYRTLSAEQRTVVREMISALASGSRQDQS